MDKTGTWLQFRVGKSEYYLYKKNRIDTYYGTLYFWYKFIAMINLAEEKKNSCYNELNAEQIFLCKKTHIDTR